MRIEDSKPHICPHILALIFARQDPVLKRLQFIADFSVFPILSLFLCLSEPVKSYLKKRADTVRCIVTALTEDGDLQTELMTGAEAYFLAQIVFPRF